MKRATKILIVADEVTPRLDRPEVKDLRPDLVVSCGDLPFDYLEYLVTVLNVPLVYVPGNHDPASSLNAASDRSRVLLVGGAFR